MTAATVQPCSGCDDPCDEIRRKIDELIGRDKRTDANGGSGAHGLKHRFAEQIWGDHGPGTTSWTNHEAAIRQQQRALQKQLKRFQENGCGDPPKGGWEWATRPVPKPAEWRGSAKDHPWVSPELARNAAIGVGGLAAGYAVYRAVRFLPSLLPPLWWTIPANAAIP
jgi:hypothetical protein